MRSFPANTLESLSTLDVTPDGELPGEFRIFRAGSNPSVKGEFIFDEQAAASVMADANARGIEYAIDLEHATISEASALRADATDAMAWFSIELRDGELWACNVRWTPEGERRLRAKSQRYISPLFRRDADNGVISLVNVALVSSPALHRAEPLVAASAAENVGATAAPRKRTKMDPNMLKAAVEAVKNGDAKSALALLEEMIVAAAGGAEETPEEPANAEALAELPAEPPKDPAKADAVPCTAAEFAALRADVVALSTRALQAEQAERVELVAELVKLGAEWPSTAWEGDPAQRKPAPVYVALSMADLKARVGAFRAQQSQRPNVRPIPRAPNSPEGESLEALSAFERETAATLEPKARAKFIALRQSRIAQ